MRSRVLPCDHGVGRRVDGDELSRFFRSQSFLRKRGHIETSVAYNVLVRDEEVAILNARVFGAGRTQFLALQTLACARLPPRNCDAVFGPDGAAVFAGKVFELPHVPHGFASGIRVRFRIIRDAMAPRGDAW